jgi:hypothetical protein
VPKDSREDLVTQDLRSKEMVVIKDQMELKVLKVLREMQTREQKVQQDQQDQHRQKVLRV